ncbi:hypothetical protein [Paraburkholderia youngii]|uniref:hypothetical protein n=1 Tax=Paraburkholderia youngii TaxID=2782701 RepID=UPI003D2101BA
MKWMIGRADDLTGDRWLSGPASCKTCRPFLFCRYRMPKGEALLVNPFGFYTASSGSTEGGAHDEQVIEQWFGLEDEHGNPAKGYKYDLLKDGMMHTPGMRICYRCLHPGACTSLLTIFVATKNDVRLTSNLSTSPTGQLL